jgi:hypothetical protein
MQTEQLTAQPLSMRGTPPPLARARLIACIAVVSQGLVNNADADEIIAHCYNPPVAQLPHDSIPPIERAS